MAGTLTMPSPAPQEIRLDHLGQVPIAQAVARTFAGTLGFEAGECERIALAASELATNCVTHGRGGTLTLAAATEGDRTGIVLTTEDRGPGISDIEQAVTDGYSTAGGLGLGLGAVHRLMDDVGFSPRPEGGLQVRCHRWLRSTAPALFSPLDCGVGSRPRRGMDANGDAFVVKQWADHALVGVLDGLGHGEAAQGVARPARLFLEEHYDQPLDRLFAGVDRLCRRTRGLVMALAHVDLAAGHFDFASVGNVEARLLGSKEGRTFVVRRGILGVNAPRPAVTTHPWTPASILVLHSDGLRSHWRAEDFPLAIWCSAAGAAHRLLQDLGKDEDDATVVVVRDGRHTP